MPYPRTHKFRGQQYRLRWRKPRKTKAENKVSKKTGDDIWGKCEPPGPNALMVVAKDKDPLFQLHTIIHEGLHACLWDLAEETITETTDSIVDLLVRMNVKVAFDGR